jgi:hypothetical protein
MTHFEPDGTVTDPPEAIVTGLIEKPLYPLVIETAVVMLY